MADRVRSPTSGGISFGLTSGVITTLGLMVGLHAGTHSTLAVVGGILTIAVADALSDALGMHMSEESHATRPADAIWWLTIATFATKLLTALTFLVPVLLFDLPTAIIVSIAWGLAVLTLLSHRLAVRQAVPPWKVIGEHLLIAGVVIALTHLLGDWVAVTFR